MYDTIKVFKSDNMPPEVRNCFFEVTDRLSYITWTVGCMYGHIKYTYPVDLWLITNGASSYEEVLIKT